MGAGQASIERQNELFPNNIEFKMQQKLTTHRAPKVEEEKNLDQKLEADNAALQHQRYLIDGVIKTFTAKKLNYSTASKGLLKNNTEKWLKKHDTATKEACIGMVRGAYFGNNRPLRKPL